MIYWLNRGRAANKAFSKKGKRLLPLRKQNVDHVVNEEDLHDEYDSILTLVQPFGSYLSDTCELAPDRTRATLTRWARFLSYILNPWTTKHNDPVKLATATPQQIHDTVKQLIVSRFVALEGYVRFLKLNYLQASTIKDYLDSIKEAASWNIYWNPEFAEGKYDYAPILERIRILISKQRKVTVAVRRESKTMETMVEERKLPEGGPVSQLQQLQAVVRDQLLVVQKMASYTITKKSYDAAVQLVLAAMYAGTVQGRCKGIRFLKIHQVW